MSIVSCDEVAKGRTGVKDQIWKRTYVRLYTVQTSAASTDQVAVMAAPGITLGNAFPTDAGAFANKIACSCTSDDGLQWEVQIEYGQYDPSTNPQNPLDWPIKITWSSVTFEEPISEDITGAAIVNSADDYFDPAPTIDNSRPVLRIVRSEATYDPVLADTYSNKINMGDFIFTGDDGMWKCSPIQADLMFNKDSGTMDGYYYDVTYEFQFNRDGWKAKLLDQGMRKLSSGNRVDICDVAGKPVTSPELLDGSGAPLATGGTPIFIAFDVYHKISYSGLAFTFTGAPGQP